MSEIITYPEMNEKIKELLGINGNACELYAVQRIVELESQLSQVQGENLKLSTENKIVVMWLEKLKAENKQLIDGIFATKTFDSLKAENEKFKAKASRYEDRLHQIHSGHCQGNSDDHGKCEDWMRKVAEQVLIEQKAFEALQPRSGE